LEIKFKDLEVRSTAVASLESTLDLQNQNIDRQEETIARRETELRELNSLLDGKINEINILKTQVAQLQSNDVATGEALRLVNNIEKISGDKEFRKRVLENQEIKNTLKSEQQQLKMDYKSRKEIFDTIQIQKKLQVEN
jgi:hypothetical protein